MKFIEIEWLGKRYKFWALEEAGGFWIHFQGKTWLWRSGGGAKTDPKGAQGEKAPLKGLILAPMPGQIQKIFARRGDKVQKGQALLVMSAMKMEYNFQAEAKGTVQEVCCRAAQTVEARQPLMKICYE